MSSSVHEAGETADQRNERQPDQWETPPLMFASTGVPNLDEVLGGGLPAGALTILVGPPGSGKTTLASQMAFARARAGQHVLLFTALSEPTNKLIAHLQTYSFCDTSLIGTSIEFLSMQPFLSEGLEEVADHVVQIARRAHADLVVLDGFRGIRDTDRTSRSHAASQFLYDIGARLSLFGMTTLITSEADAHDPMFFAEATTTDVIIALHYHLVGERAHRALEVVKVRGARLMPGLHGFHLDEHGGVVFPRLEARVALPRASGEPETNDAEQLEAGNTSSSVVPIARSRTDDGQDTPVGRAAFALPELDALLSGGLPRETSTLVVGSLGTGKTLMALHFALAGVRAGEPVLFVGFRENQRQLVRLASAFTIGDELRRALAPGGGMIWQRWPPIEMNPDIVADRLLAALDRSRARRLVIDGIAELERAIARLSDASRIGDFVAALVEALHERQVTSLFLTEHPKVVAPAIDFSTDPISVVAENVLLLQQLRYQAELHRVLSVLKMRLSAHDLMLREFVINAPDGIRVLLPGESPVDALVSLAEGLPLHRSQRRSSRANQLDGPAAQSTAKNAPARHTRRAQETNP